VYSVEFKAKY